MKVAIIGCGFSGTMTAVHLIKNAALPFELILIDKRESFNKGIAYHPNSKIQLLNVIASRMSAFQDKPAHFLNWVAVQDEFSSVPGDVLANTFLPRYLYGQYLTEIWEEAVRSSNARQIQITIKDAMVIDMEVDDHQINLMLDNDEKLNVQYCVIASGNLIPRNPSIQNDHFFNSSHYFRNPWGANAAKNPDPKTPVLILGNGLTMADTVLSMVENGFKSKIYTISPHGYNILPHKHHDVGYSSIAEELQGRPTLVEIVRIVNKHIRIARKQGYSPEPVIDAIRPLTQKLWSNLSSAEKKMFMSRMRHLWDNVRHRIPLQVHDKLRQMTKHGKLQQFAGKLLGVTEVNGLVNVLFYDYAQQRETGIMVSTVINCTGPETDLMKVENSFLKNCLLNGTIVQDELKLGILADPLTFEIYDELHQKQKKIHAIGSLLKGVLWESTAVNELRQQAELISKELIYKMQE